MLESEATTEGVLPGEPIWTVPSFITTAILDDSLKCLSFAALEEDRRRGATAS